MEALPPWLLNMLAAASPLGATIAFLFLLRAWRSEERERTERIEVQATKDELHRRTHDALTGATLAVNNVTLALQDVRQIVQAIERERRRNGRP